MVENEPLYFLTGTNQYKKAKLGLLEAKSYLLNSRNILKNLKKLNNDEEEAKREIKKSASECINLIKEMKSEELPKVKSAKVDIKEIKKKVTIKPKNKSSNEKNDIDLELEEINRKITELANS